MAKDAPKTQFHGLEECSPVSKNKPAARATQAAANRSLCERCVWDCVQPFGVTVACPNYSERAPEQERQARSGQLSFGFGADAGGRRAAQGGRQR